MRKIRTWMLFAAVALLAGCSTPAPEADEAAKHEVLPRPKFTLTAANSGKTSWLEVSEGAKIQLRENGTTGFLWQFQIRGDNSAFKIVDMGNTSLQTDEKLVGAPNLREIMIVALKPGSAWLVGEYRRSWEKDVPPADTVRFHFEVIPWKAIPGT